MSDKGKKVLILGNGFDLAHKLPTKYEHFLEFAKYALIIYKYMEGGHGTPYKDTINSWNGHSYLKERLLEAFKNRRGNTKITSQGTHETTYTVNERLDSFNSYIASNIWYCYLYSLHKDGLMRGVNWIDFESEISYVIQFLDKVHDSLDEPYYSFYQKFRAGDIIDKANGKPQQFFTIVAKCTEYRQGDRFSLRDLRKKLYIDLEKLILAFEIYLTDFVEKIPIKSKIQAIEEIKPDYVLTFNYSRTYEKNYVSYDDNVEICHIHGVCDENREDDKNNMVLGIDEYWGESEIADNTDFAIFRKFVQRIRKKTDTSYARWVRNIERVYNSSGDTWSGITDEIENHYPDRISEVWCYGHSLDITDRDVLRGFLGTDATAIHIFSYDKPDEGELVSKLLSIVDYKTVIEKSTSSPCRLDFIPMEHSEC